MALIDTFLKLMLEKRAERLVLVSGSIPFLLKNGETIHLSMPALPAELLRRICREISDSPSPADPDSTRHEGLFQNTDGNAFAYLALPSPQGPRLEFHLLGTPRQESGPEAPELSTPAKASTPSPSHHSSPDLLHLIDQALTHETSEIFLSSGKPIRIRRHGRIITLSSLPCPDSRQILDLLPNDPSRHELETLGSTASSTIHRIVDVFPGHQQPSIRSQLSVSLRAVLAQLVHNSSIDRDTACSYAADPQALPHQLT